MLTSPGLRPPPHTHRSKGDIHTIAMMSTSYRAGCLERWMEAGEAVEGNGTGAGSGGGGGGGAGGGCLGLF